LSVEDEPLLLTGDLELVLLRPAGRPGGGRDQSAHGSPRPALKNVPRPPGSRSTRTANPKPRPESSGHVASSGPVASFSAASTGRSAASTSLPGDPSRPWWMPGSGRSASRARATSAVRRGGSAVATSRRMAHLALRSRMCLARQAHDPRARPIRNPAQNHPAMCLGWPRRVVLGCLDRTKRRVHVLASRPEPAVVDAPLGSIGIAARATATVRPWRIGDHDQSAHAHPRPVPTKVPRPPGSRSTRTADPKPRPESSGNTGGRPSGMAGVHVIRLRTELGVGSVAGCMTATWPRPAMATSTG